MTRMNRRAVIGLGALTAAAALAAVPRKYLAKRLSNWEFDALEESTGLRRLISPIPGERSGWVKYSENPVLGGQLGVCFDVSVLRQESGYEMWFSWRPKSGIGRAVSTDGMHWSNVQLVLSPLSIGSSQWCTRINRPKVIYLNGKYQMWYTGQDDEYSAIGMAESEDGLTWKVVSEHPVFTAEVPWEKGVVMAPEVLWDEAEHKYRMWYSAGGQFEPAAIGYAESVDGMCWQRRRAPVFMSAPGAFDSSRVAAPCVVPRQNDFLLFYIGYRNIEESAVCMAKSVNGVDNWIRNPLNPIIGPGKSSYEWDYDAVYRPAVTRTNDRWMVWYNGRRGRIEQIGLAIHEGTDIGF